MMKNKVFTLSNRFIIRDAAVALIKNKQSTLEESRAIRAKLYMAFRIHDYDLLDIVIGTINKYSNKNVKLKYTNDILLGDGKESVTIHEKHLESYNIPESYWCTTKGNIRFELGGDAHE